MIFQTSHFAGFFIEDIIISPYFLIVHYYICHQVLLDLLRQDSNLHTLLRILKTNQKNEQKSIGSVTDTGVNEQEGSDPFLEGFNSV